MGSRDPALGRLLGRVSLRSSRHAGTTVVVILVSTLIVGSGILRLESDSDLLKILPEDDPNTLAAEAAAKEFRGFYDFVTFFYGIEPEKCDDALARLPNRVVTYDRDNREITCDSVLHEAYIRGMDEVWHFLQKEIPSAEYAIDYANLVKIVNWTNDGFFGGRPQDTVVAPLLSGDLDEVGRPADDRAFSMPSTDPAGAARFAAAFQGVQAADEAAEDTVARNLQAGRTIIFFNTTGGDLSRVDLGRAVYRAVDVYQAEVLACDAGDECRLDWNVFSAEGLAVSGVSAVDAHASDVTARDIQILAPIIIFSIIVILYAAFRDPRVIVVAAANLFVAFLWTAGLMGWLSIPFSALNLTIVPLILGVGIDYGIHMVSEFLEHKSDGLDNEQAFRLAGRRAGIALAIATITTIGGLILMVWSPSVLMGQLAIVSSIALGVTFLFTMTLIPALLTLTARGEIRRSRHQGSRAIVTMAAWVARRRVPIGLFVLVVSGLAFANVQRNLEVEAFGNPELNYPPGDRLRDDADWISREFFAAEQKAQSNYFIVQGDLTRPEIHGFLDRLTENLQADDTLEGFNTASLTRVVRGWLAINQGTPDAVVSQFVLGNVPDDGVRDAEYPTTKEEMEGVFDEIFASPFANFMTILLNRGYDMGMVSFDTHQETNFEESKRVWDAAFRVVDETRAETGITEEDLQVHMFGNNAFSYLFITKEQPWVNTIGIASFALVVLIIASLTRNLRATLCTASVMAVTSLWWLGALPAMGIGVSVGLMLPLVFIMAIGSDDAVHLIWNMELTSDRARVYRFVGLAVFLTSITTVIAFSIFSFQTDLLVRRTLLATAAAVAVMWIATVLVVPLFYPPRPGVAPSLAPAMTATSRRAAPGSAAPTGRQVARRRTAHRPRGPRQGTT